MALRQWFCELVIPWTRAAVCNCPGNNHRFSLNRVPIGPRLFRCKSE